MRVSDDENLVVAQHPRDETVARQSLGPQFFRGQHEWIDFAAERRLLMPKFGDDLFKR
ncbi:MAG: hypothetical protein SGJ19_26015 [Planctomycetia bacterium]|nr:hypothetical protein [Planctomycetia bacterium]